MSLTKQHLRELVAALSPADFPDYRSYFRAIYEAAKDNDPHYSFVRLSEDLGLASTNAHSVINGKRSLSAKAVERIAQSLNLSAPHRKYLLALVRQEAARTPEEREQAFRDRLELKGKEVDSRVDRNILAFFEHWHHAAIMELLRIESASDDPAWIADALHPKIGLVAIKRSLELLKSLGYLAFDSKRQRLYPSTTRVSTGDEIAYLAIMSYHRQMLDLAVQAMDQVRSEDRDISAITMLVTPELRDEFRRDLIALRKKFLDRAESNQSGTEVVQVNFQIFPVASCTPAPDKRLKR